MRRDSAKLKVVIGTWLNVAGIVAGGVFGLLRPKPLSLPNQFFFKAALGALTVWFGLRLTWMSLSGSFLHVLQQLAIVVVALAIGRLLGRLLHLQKGSNHLGHFARERMVSVKPDDPHRISDGFNVCATLFCAAPLGIVGAICDGLTESSGPGYFYPLAVKALMDGLAAMSFVGMFGTGVLLSAVPVLVFQGSLTILCARLAQPWLQAHGLLESVTAVGGMLIFCVALVIFEIRRIELTDYLPSLAIAPLLTYWMR